MAFPFLFGGYRDANQQCQLWGGREFGQCPIERGINAANGLGRFAA